MVQLSLQYSVIQHKIDNELVNQRALDGYVDATAMCKASGKEFGHYYEQSCVNEGVQLDITICDLQSSNSDSDS